MKLTTCVLSCLVALLFLSARTEKAAPTEGYRLGDLAPGIEYAENDEMIDFSNSECYTLVNFWAAYDATSRVRNMQLWNKVNELDSTQLMFYSISMDENQSVFTETLKTDKLGTTNQLCYKEGKNSPVYKKYGLKNGFCNFLINKEGIIVAKDVTPDELLQKINGTEHL